MSGILRSGIKQTAFKSGLCLLAGVLIITGCKEKEQHRAENKIITVSAQQEATDLHFSSHIEPRKIVNVTGRVDGEVDKRYFNYGDYVKEGQILLTIRSDKLTREYQETLSAYLKAKEQFHSGESKWRGIQQLTKLGLKSESEYQEGKRTYYEHQFNFYQQRKKLLEILEKTSSKAEEIIDSLDNVSFSDIDAVNKLLGAAHDKMQIHAPVKGTVLFSENDGSSEKKSLHEGDPVKEKDVLFAIGDLSGFSISIKVNEMNILKIKKGQKVNISGAAFPSINLHGVVDALDTQASKGQGGLPVFNVHIVVPNVNDEQLKLIHVGMTSQVAIHIESPTEIHVPIKAVHSKHGRKWVEVVQADGSSKLVAVDTGATSFSDVVIEHGLKPGDKIVLPD